MSKLVVKIRDDDKHFPHCPLHHEGYCHLPQTHYLVGNALYMQQCLGFINKRPPWCPLKEEKEAIPIEFIEERIKKAVAFTHSKAEGNIIDDGCVVTVVSASFTAQVLANLLKAWEGENEID